PAGQQGEVIAVGRAGLELGALDCGGDVLHEDRVRRLATPAVVDGDGPPMLVSESGAGGLVSLREDSAAISAEGVEVTDERLAVGAVLLRRRQRRQGTLGGVLGGGLGDLLTHRGVAQLLLSLLPDSDLLAESSLRRDRRLDRLGVLGAQLLGLEPVAVPAGRTLTGPPAVDEVAAGGASGRVQNPD